MSNEQTKFRFYNHYGRCCKKIAWQGYRPQASFNCGTENCWPSQIQSNDKRKDNNWSAVLSIQSFITHKGIWLFPFYFRCFLLFCSKDQTWYPFVEDFRVSLKKPDSVGGARILAPQISEAVGINLYGLPRCADDALDIAFASNPLLGLLRKINFNRVQQFNFSPVRLDVIASLDTPEFCVEQALIFRDLLALVNYEAFERNKSLFE